MRSISQYSQAPVVVADALDHVVAHVVTTALARCLSQSIWGFLLSAFWLPNKPQLILTEAHWAPGLGHTLSESTHLRESTQHFCGKGLHL